jgi:amino acid transporter
MTDQEQGLKRELTARQMAMVAVGGSIGTGLLLGSGAAIQVAGPAVVLTFVLSALISWTVAMALGEMSSVHPAAGSFGVYAEIYLNRWAGFMARYGYWLAAIIAIGSEVVAAGTYMRVWFPGVPVDQSFFRGPLRRLRILVCHDQGGHDLCFYPDRGGAAVGRQGAAAVCGERWPCSQGLALCGDGYLLRTLQLSGY